MAFLSGSRDPKAPEMGPKRHVFDQGGLTSPKIIENGQTKDGGALKTPIGGFLTTWYGPYSHLGGPGGSKVAEMVTVGT